MSLGHQRLMGGKHQQPMSVCSSIGPAPTDDCVLDGVPTSYGDDFCSDFKFKSTHSVHPCLLAHSDDIPQPGVVPAIGSSKKRRATLEDTETLLSHRWSMPSCLGDDEAEASASYVLSTPSNSHAETSLGNNVLDILLPACNDDFPTSFASKATCPVRRLLCTQAPADGPQFVRSHRKRKEDVLQSSTPPSFDVSSSSKNDQDYILPLMRRLLQHNKNICRALFTDA